MSEDKELSRLESEWKNRFDRFTVPEPSREQTLELLQRIKGTEEAKPVDERFTLELSQKNQSTSKKIMNLLLSQLNYYGIGNWLFAAVMMLTMTIVVSLNMSDEISGFLAWIKWSTLVMIAMMGFAFRTKDEGNKQIETLSYYPLNIQWLARFLIVTTLQLVMTLPLSFIILKETNSIYYLVGILIPILFFGVAVFVSVIWFGQYIGLGVTLLIWFLQSFYEKKLTIAALFKVPSSEGFILTNSIILLLSIVLLASLLFKKWRIGKLT